MENEQDKKTKDNQIPQEELFGELDAMYQRVADIEKEEASEALGRDEAGGRTQEGDEKGFRKKSGPNRKRSYRPIILGAVAVLFAAILAITFWKQTAVLQLLNLGDKQQPTVSPPPRPRKPAVATPQASPPPPLAATSPASPAPPSVATSSAPAGPPAKNLSAQATQEASKSPQKESEKTKPIPQETVKPDKPLPQEKYYSVQVGSFRNMENVRDLAGVLKKEGLEAYWMTMRGKKGETLHRVFVGQFTDKNEAAQFLKDKKILRNYPGSFIQEVSSSDVMSGTTK